MKIDTAIKAHELYNRLQYLLDVEKDFKRSSTIKIFDDATILNSFGKHDNISEHLLNILKKEVRNMINETKDKIEKLV